MHIAKGPVLLCRCYPRRFSIPRPQGDTKAGTMRLIRWLIAKLQVRRYRRAQKPYRDAYDATIAAEQREVDRLYAGLDEMAVTG